MDRPYFTFFKSYFEAIAELEKEDQLETLLAICSYSLTEETPEMTSKVARAIFKAIKPTIDANIKQYKNGSKPKASQKEAKRKPKGSQTLTNKDKEKEKEYINNKPPTPLKGRTWFEDPELEAVFKSYIEYRKKNRIPTTEHALELARDKLLKMAEDTPTRIAIINQTLERGWRGLFPLDTQKQKQKNGFNNFKGQRDYDFEELEKVLVANGGG